MNDEIARYRNPEARMPPFRQGLGERTLLCRLAELLRADKVSANSLVQADSLFSLCLFPQRFCRLVMVLYAPGHKRVVVSREESAEGCGNLRFSSVFKRLLAHPRRRELVRESFRLQLDFVVEPPIPVDLYKVGMEHLGERHFEIGVDGVTLRGGDGKLLLFLPGDAYVRSIMGMGQLRDYLHRVYGEEYVRQAETRRFRSESFISNAQENNWLISDYSTHEVSGHRVAQVVASGTEMLTPVREPARSPQNEVPCARLHWLRLYRGYPLVGELSREKVENALALAIDHIRRTQEEGGKFLYYYDSTLDSRRDHEHLRRDPQKNPFYNILRHGGGGLTCIFHEKITGKGDTLENIRRAIDYLTIQTRYQEYDGRPGAYIYSEKKAKLGGTGIALYLVAEYQLLTGDQRHREWADALAWHLLHQITASGEFIYYNIYLDQPVSEEENQKYFSFYYPGEAICGLAKYLHLPAPEERAPYFAKLKDALHFLLFVRPQTRAGEYTAVPSDSWLMMGIMELWDFPEMQNLAYADFVFSDAEKMIANLYKVDDAPYPDYAGAFYYQYGDYPYADGARCEGLLGAYELARKMGQEERAAGIWRALKLAAWAVMHLVNTPDAIYFARNPNLALGGIRFKYTRQWFRIDTIQHVASFFAKILPHWERAEAAER